MGDTQQWAAVAVVRNEGGLDHQWDTVTYSISSGGIAQRWKTNEGLVGSFGINEQWTVTPVPAEATGITHQWGTNIPADDAGGIGQDWQTVPVTAQLTGIAERWFTDAAPSQLAILGHGWAVACPAVQPAGLDAQWQSASPTSDPLQFWQSWQTRIPDIETLGLNELWYWNMLNSRSWEVTWGGKFTRSWAFRCDLGMDEIKRSWELDAAMLVSITRSWELDASSKSTDSIKRSWSFSCPMLDDSAIIVATPPSVTVRGQSIVLESAEVNIDEGEFAYTCELTFNNPDDVALFGPDEPFTVTIGAENYAFIRQDDTFTRDGQVNLTATVSGISPGAIYAEPRAEKITRTWDDAVLVSAVLEELFGAGVVELRVLDWTIPAKRLAVASQTPMGIAQQIARATGGLIESEPDGSLYIRYAWPVSVPFMADATPDQVYDDTRDAFRIVESAPPSRVSNKFRIIDVADSSSGLLQAEIDSREAGLNSGRTSFIPGDQPGFLIFKGERVAVDNVRPSAGNIVSLAAGNMDVSETLSFAGTQEARLKYPTAAILSYKWLGNNLGVPVLIDEATVSVPVEGVGLLMVTYQTAFLARRVSGVPAVINGETEYDVLVLVEGSQS